MQNLSAIVIMNPTRVVILVVCLLSIGFLLWFLVGLILDERKTRARNRRVSRSHIRVQYRNTFGADSQESGAAAGSEPKNLNAEPQKQTAWRPPTGKPLEIVRLSDKEAAITATTRLSWLIMGLLLSGSVHLFAQAPDTPPTSNQQTAPAAPASPSPLTTPAITGPLQAAAPIEFDGGPLGKLDLDGIVSGMGLWQGNHVPGDDVGQAALSNGQVWIQKTPGWWQFYAQAGAYNILALGTPFLPTDKALTDLYGPVPVAFVKLVPGKNTSIQIGALPTLMGAEYTFDFENMNIERGLLWNQENAVNRGIQVNQTMGKFTVSISWNDGYYSNRYSWLSGSLAYVNGPHSISFIGMGDLGQTVRQAFATPVQNNGSMYAVIYTYTKAGWIV